MNAQFENSDRRGVSNYLLEFPFSFLYYYFSFSPQTTPCSRLFERDFVLVSRRSFLLLQMNAQFENSDQRGVSNYLLEFRLLPTSDPLPSVTFAVMGVAPKLVSLSCRCEHDRIRLIYVSRYACIYCVCYVYVYVYASRSDPVPSVTFAVMGVAPKLVSLSCR